MTPDWKSSLDREKLFWQCNLLFVKHEEEKLISFYRQNYCYLSPAQKKSCNNRLIKSRVSPLCKQQCLSIAAQQKVDLNLMPMNQKRNGLSTLSIGLAWGFGILGVLLAVTGIVFLSLITGGAAPVAASIALGMTVGGLGMSTTSGVLHNLHADTQDQKDRSVGNLTKYADDLVFPAEPYKPLLNPDKLTYRKLAASSAASATDEIKPLESKDGSVIGDRSTLRDVDNTPAAVQATQDEGLGVGAARTLRS